MKHYVRRIIGMVMSLILSIGLYTGVFAETAVEVPITDVVYWNREQLKVADKFTDEQWNKYFADKYNKFETMTDEGWENFYTSYEYFYETEEFYNTTDEEYDAYFELYEKVYEKYTTNGLKYYKIANNYPNPDGINIKFNNKFIELGKNEPIVVEGSVFIPLDKTIMEELGLNYNYNEKEGTILVKLNEKQVLMKLDTKDMQVTENESTKAIELYSPPFKSTANNITYIPIDFLELGFQYDVTTDYDDDDLIIIIDKERIIDELDKDFIIMNKFLSGVDKGKDNSINEKGAFNTTLILYGDKKDSKSDLKSTFDITHYKGNWKVKGNLNVDADMLIELYENIYGSYYNQYYGYNDSSVSGTNTIKSLKNMPFELIYNTESKLVYIKCEALNKMQDIDKNAWLMIDWSYMEDYYGYGIFGGNYKTIGGMLYEGSYGYEESYKSAANECIQIFGDRQFKKTSSNGIDTYTIDISKNINELFQGLYGMSNMGLSDGSGKISFSEDSTGNQEIHILTEAKLQSGYPCDFRLKYDRTKEKATFVLEITGQYIGKMTAEMTLDSIKADNSSVIFEPPVGETIIEY